MTNNNIIVAHRNYLLTIIVVKLVYVDLYYPKGHRLSAPPPFKGALSIYNCIYMMHYKMSFNHFITLYPIAEILSFAIIYLYVKYSLYSR